MGLRSSFLEHKVEVRNLWALKLDIATSCQQIETFHHKLRLLCRTLAT